MNKYKLKEAAKRVAASWTDGLKIGAPWRNMFIG